MNLQQFVRLATPETIQKIASVLRSGKPSKVASELKASNMWPFVIDFVKATYLFTGGHVATVRNPEGFNYDMVEPWFDFIGHQPFGVQSLLGTLIDMDPDPFMDPPTKEDYLKANFLIRQMATIAGKGNKAIYRGLKAVPANIFLDLCKPGETYSLGTMASASSFRSEALTFATSWKHPPRYRIMYMMENPEGKGTPISSFSAYPSEMEVIIGGDIKIERFSFAPIIKGLSDELQDKWRSHGNIAEFKDLVEFVEDLETDARGTSDNPGVERYDSLGVIDAGVAYVFATVL